MKFFQTIDMIQFFLYFIISLMLLMFILGSLFTSVWQDKFIFWGKPLKPDFQFQPLERKWKEVFIDTDSGKIHALHFYTESNNKKGVVLFFHGNTGNLDRWKNVAHQFTSRNYDVLMPDYRGFGKSMGKKSQQNFYTDAVRWFDLMVEKYPNYPIIVYGKSIGSAAASYVAGNRNPLKVIMETPFYSMKDLFYTYYSFLPRIFKFKYPFENWKYLSQSKAKISIILAGKDLVVPLKCSSKLKSILKNEDELIIVKEGQHNDLAMYDIFQSFLDRNLS